MKISKMIIPALLLIGVLFVSGCGRILDHTDGALDTTAPTVLSTIPGDGDANVVLNSKLTATFSEEMNAETVSSTSFTLSQGATAISSTVTYAGNIGTLSPDVNLTANTVYTATLTTAVKDLAGNPLAITKTWNFTTGVALDSTAPTVLSTVPINGASGIAINSNLTATFSEPMDSATITSGSFILKQGTTTIAATVTYLGNVGTLNPASNLANNTGYTATILTTVTDLAGNPLTVTKTWNFTTAVVADTTAPTVLSTLPANGATGIAITSNVTANLSEAMNAATITSASFTLKQGATPISATVTYVGTTGILNPNNSLTNNTVYTATILTTVTDLAGNPLAVTKTWSFTTDVAPDTTAPTVLSTLPANGATGIAITSNVRANFSETMDSATITSVSFTLKQGATSINATVTYVGNVGTLNPDSSLTYNTLYTATITTAVKDSAGNALAVTKTWSFTTDVAPDTAAPTVLSTVPANGTTGVDIDSNVSANFSEAMDSSTITSVSFTLKQGATPISATVTYVGTVGKLNPNNDLLANTVYTAEIATTVKDVAGNNLTVTKNWSFTTAVASVPLAVNLGTAGGFAVLSKAGISASGTTAIIGHIGVSPIAATAMTGFGLTMDGSNEFSISSLVTGRAYAANYTEPTPTNLTTAISNMETAFTDAAGRTNPTATELGAGNIGGMTITAGLYKWGTNVLIPTDVTLSGSPTDVWIFQISNDLIMSTGASILLAGGALPENIFWQVEGATTIGSGAHIEGIVLCKTAIIMNSGSTIKGRMLAQTAVTLGTTCTVTQP